MPGLPEHHDGNSGEDDGASKSRQNANLPGAEGVAAVMGMFTGKDESDPCNAQSGSVGAHMPAIRQECHGASHRACHDFDHHGKYGQPCYPCGTPFALVVMVAEFMRM